MYTYNYMYTRIHWLVTNLNSTCTCVCTSECMYKNYTYVIGFDGRTVVLHIHVLHQYRMVLVGLNSVY